jgi:hypothetical protein
VPLIRAAAKALDASGICPERHNVASKLIQSVVRML